MKFSLYSKKNVLDEMQEQTMSKICLLYTSPSPRD